jgi:hypothetical protein
MDLNQIERYANNDSVCKLLVSDTSRVFANDQHEYRVAKVHQLLLFFPNEMERPCTILIGSTKSDPPQVAALKKQLESKDQVEKRRAMKSIILYMQQGENLNQLLMHVIRFALPTTTDHEMKKLLLIYWEMFEKHNEQGKLLPEMILVV